MDATTLLSGYSKGALNAIAKGMGVPGLIKDRTELVATIAKQMDNPAAVAAALTNLSKDERSLLERVQLAGGEIGAPALRSIALRDGISENLSRPSSYSIMPIAHSRIFEHQIARLISFGLVLSPGGNTRTGLNGFELNGQAIIPAPVLAALPAIANDKGSFAADAPRHIRSGDAATFQRDLYLYWGFLRDNEVALTVRGLMPKPQLRRVNGLLSQQEDLETGRDESNAGRLRFLRGVLMGCGLVKVQDGLLRPVPDSESFFAESLARRVRATFHAYRDGAFWDELDRIPGLMVIGRPASIMQAQPFLIRARKTVITQLADLPAEGWNSLSPLLEYIRTRRYEFLLPRKRNPYSYGRADMVNPYESYGNDVGWSFRRETGTPSPKVFTSFDDPEDSDDQFTESFLRDEQQGWLVVEAGLIATILAEPLHWLGLLDLGMDAEGRFVALRATAYGAHELHNAPLPEESAPISGRLIVQPTFQVLAYPPVSEVQLALLDRIAERGRLEQVAEYRLTRDSLYRARQQHGITVDQVIADLERESGAPLPQNVAYTLQEWHRAQERVSLLENVALLRVSHGALLDRLATEAPSLAFRRVSPELALVAPQDLSAVQERLLALGQIPLLVDQAPNLELGGQWLVVAPDGGLALRPAAPALYLRRALRVFAVEEGSGWRLTTASVRQAAADGTPPDRMLALLRAWSGGPLPSELERQIKIWGGIYGAVSLEQPMLLRAADERTLAALREDPELAALLRPVERPELLAVVDPDQVARLTALLAARGVTLAAPVAAPTEAPAETAPRRRGRSKNP